jgi:predicted dehydrogenase
MDRVRLGIVGCGGFARWHMTNLSQITEVDIVAMADPDPSQIERSVRHHAPLADAAKFSDMNSMIEAGGLDAVLLVTPHTQHLSQIQAGFAAGLHVAVEKPLCPTVDECLSAIAARNMSGKIGFLSYQRHTSAEYRLIRDRILAGEIGEIQYASVFLCQEWNRFTVGSWRQDPALSGGGMLLDSGSHMLDALLWCTGLEPETVSGVTDNRGTPVEINSAATIKFKNGAMGTITVCGDAHAWREEFTIWGSKGTILLRDGQISFVSENGSRMRVEEARGGSTPDQNFINAILGREEVYSPFEAGLAVTRLTEAVYRSASQGGAPVKA